MIFCMVDIYLPTTHCHIPTRHVRGHCHETRAKENYTELISSFTTSEWLQTIHQSECVNEWDASEE
jgi:hypothetical protein